MKLILQIALGVFLGTAAAQFSLELYHNRQAKVEKAQSEKMKAEQDKKRQDQINQLRSLILQNQHNKIPPAQKAPDEIIPGDTNATD
ncbi:MAG: hypothetical protein FJ190_03300 [Gammaproteobacteria bacterium]|nr:hypothetical protein [Gammaproteobacteria bacterium]